jgi:hypothetical protein
MNGRRRMILRLAVFVAIFVFLEFSLVFRWQQYGGAVVMGVALTVFALLDVRAQLRKGHGPQSVTTPKH